MKQRILFVFALVCSLQVFYTQAQNQVHYDESKVPEFVLPPLLTLENGKQVTNKTEWEQARRPELLAIFTNQMFGKIPTEKVDVKYKTLEQADDALDGTAIRKQIEITFSRNGVTRKALLLMFIPNKATTKVPVFLHFNFQGNHSISNDPVIIPSPHSTYTRGHQISRWPLKKIIDAGYALATVHYDDFYPDNPDSKEGFAKSILPMFGYQSAEDIPDNGGQAIAAWAWGYIRIMDYLETDKQIDSKKVMLMGHSRLGKTALWAGVNDKRVAIVSSNDAGCGGDALSKRRFGETVKVLNEGFPYWFNRNFHQYNDKEDEMPFDQHQLLALVAPRPLYIASAEDDKWADPKGQFLSAAYTEEVYNLYGYKGLGTTTMPAISQPIMNRVGYHIRPGIHDVTDEDWDNYILFANKWFR